MARFHAPKLISQIQGVGGRGGEKCAASGELGASGLSLWSVLDETTHGAACC